MNEHAEGSRAGMNIAVSLLAIYWEKLDDTGKLTFHFHAGSKKYTVTAYADEMPEDRSRDRQGNGCDMRVYSSGVLLAYAGAGVRTLAGPGDAGDTGVRGCARAQVCTGVRGRPHA